MHIYVYLYIISKSTESGSMCCPHAGKFYYQNVMQDIHSNRLSWFSRSNGQPASYIIFWNARITNNTPPSHDTSAFHRLDACMPILHPQSTAQKLTTKLPSTVRKIYFPPNPAPSPPNIPSSDIASAKNTASTHDMVAEWSRSAVEY